jgi:hypothetical protein
VSGLLSSDEEPTATAPTATPVTHEKKEITLEDLSPSLIRQLKKLLKSSE